MVLPLGLLLACCCCCPDTDGVAGVVDGVAGVVDGDLGDGVAGAAPSGPAGFPRGFTSDDIATLMGIARRISKDTGRTCGDFFPTLLEPGATQDLALAGRATLLKKVNNMNDAERSFASTTICVNVEKKEFVPTPPPRPAPVLAKPRRFAVFLEQPGTLLNQRVSDVDFATRAGAEAAIPPGGKLRVGPFRFGSGLQFNIISVPG